jgi:hypothetical protein
MNAWRAVMPRLLSKYPVDSRCDDRKRHALCWNVKMHNSPDFDKVWKKMCTPDFEYINEAEAITRIPSIPNLREEWEQVSNAMYEAALETMRESFLGDDTMKFVTPEREKKWGISCGDNGLDCKYAFFGRSGGWLVLTHFMGMDIDTEMVELPEVGYEMHRLVDNYRLPYLYAMIEEISHMVSHRDEELVYQLAFNMRYNMPETVPE